MKTVQNNTKSCEATYSLKEAATKFNCSAHTLKNNIKSNKLAASQSEKGSAHMMRHADVERFLRDSPGIASIYHPAESKSTVAREITDERVKAEALPDKAPATDESPVLIPARSEAVERQKPTPPPDLQQAPCAETVAGETKRRRRRRRGKGGSQQQAPAEIQLSKLKALVGTTPQERLRITACLTELVNLVAFSLTQPQP